MRIFYNPDYAASEYAFDTTRKSALVRASLDRSPLVNVEFADPADLYDETGRIIGMMHGPRYVDAVRTGEPPKLAQSNGFPWDPTMYRMALAHSAGVVAGAREAIATGSNAGTLSSGLHHAKRWHGDGFCTFNGIAAAVIDTLARDHGARVAVLDFDAHCGGGTDDLVGTLEDVVHIDLHTDAFDHYPTRPGSWSGTAETADEYMSAVTEGLAFMLDAHNERPFDLCIYNAGVDPIDEAFIDGSDLSIRDNLVAMAVTRREIPTVFTLAGGYTGENLNADQLVDLHRTTIAAFSTRAAQRVTN